jgi:hypothetical protein
MGGRPQVSIYNLLVNSFFTFVEAKPGGASGCSHSLSDPSPP